MTLRIGCVGCGNMGGAIMSGLARPGTRNENRNSAYTLCGYNRTASRMQALEKAGVRVMRPHWEWRKTQISSCWPSNPTRYAK